MVFLYCRPGSRNQIEIHQRAGAASEGDALLCSTDILSTCLTGPGIPPEVTEGDYTSCSNCIPLLC